jgi:hypothetical protein
MASRFSASDVAALSRDQKIEALGIALRMKGAQILWKKDGEAMTDQECLDTAIGYEFDPSSSPRLTFTYGDGTDWADDDSFNPYRWRSRSWLYRLWKTDPLPVSPDDYGLRRAKLWTLDPDWNVPWPHEPGRPDLPA